MILITIVLFLVSLILLIYNYINKNQTYWKRKNIPYCKPKFPYGNIGDVGKLKHSAINLQQLYKQLKSGNRQRNEHLLFGGIFYFHNPVILALHLNFIKNVLIKDFNSFHDRGVYYNEIDDPLSAHLFALAGKKWKNLRNKLTPTFTSGKMKFMFPTIVKVGENFEKCLLNEILQLKNYENCKQSIEIEMKEYLARYTTDVIGTCAFGINCNSLINPLAEFRQIGKQIFDKKKTNIIKRLFVSSFKNVARRLKMKTIDENVSKFLLNIVKETIEYRELNNYVSRNDFMDLLIQLKQPCSTTQTNTADADGADDNEVNAEKNDSDSLDRTITDNMNNEPLTINQIGAQAFVFFIAGFETSSTAMTFCLYELAVNKTIQMQARNEIKNVIRKHNDQLTYECVMDMKYLDQIINETLRKYPPVGSLTRMVTKDYYVPEMKCMLEKNTTLIIPVYAIHHDPEYYKNPEIFDPMRFHPDEIKKRNPLTFLPFGDGPRNCIGIRFGLMQIRIGLIVLLRKFEFSLNEKLSGPIVLEPKSIALSPVGGLHLIVNEIL